MTVPTQKTETDLSQKESIGEIEETTPEETKDEAIKTNFNDLELSSDDSDFSLDKDAPNEITQIHRNNKRTANFQTIVHKKKNLNTLGHWSIQISHQQKMCRQTTSHRQN